MKPDCLHRRIPQSLCALLLGSICVHANADTLYKCTGESGVVLYTNQKSSGKNCTILSRELPISTISTPSRAPGAIPPRPANGTTPADFPRIDSTTQRGRDTDRRKILEQEFATEQQNLEKAKKALTEGEATRLSDEKSYQKYLERLQELKDGVTLHERNLEALKRELANLR